MTYKEKRELKDGVISIFKSFNILDHTATIGGLRNDILECIDSLQEEPTTSVWHDANTLPSNPKAVIVEHNEYSTSICRAEQMSRIKGAKWAYVEDLLKL